MKRVVYIILALVIVTFGANANAATDVELFIGNIHGITDQDKALCRSAWKNGGRYFTRIYDATLDCSRNHISVDFDREE